jgi:hypothetical protein
VTDKDKKNPPPPKDPRRPKPDSLKKVQGGREKDPKKR